MNLKYDGFRMLVQRDGERVRLITRGGYDWTKRYQWIVQAALKNTGAIQRWCG
jgi:bifunctional non-homologous end joining protein LigD